MPLCGARGATPSIENGLHVHLHTHLNCDLSLKLQCSCCSSTSQGDWSHKTLQPAYHPLPSPSAPRALPQRAGPIRPGGHSIRHPTNTQFQANRLSSFGALGRPKQQGLMSLIRCRRHPQGCSLRLFAGPSAVQCCTSSSSPAALVMSYTSPSRLKRMDRGNRMHCR